MTPINMEDRNNNTVLPTNSRQQNSQFLNTFNRRDQNDNAASHITSQQPSTALNTSNLEDQNDNTVLPTTSQQNNEFNLFNIEPLTELDNSNTGSENIIPNVSAHPFLVTLNRGNQNDNTASDTTSRQQNNDFLNTFNVRQNDNTVLPTTSQQPSRQQNIDFLNTFNVRDQNGNTVSATTSQQPSRQQNIDFLNTFSVRDQNGNTVSATISLQNIGLPNTPNDAVRIIEEPNVRSWKDVLSRAAPYLTGFTGCLCAGSGISLFIIGTTQVLPLFLTGAGTLACVFSTIVGISRRVKEETHPGIMFENNDNTPSVRITMEAPPPPYNEVNRLENTPYAYNQSQAGFGGAVR